MMHLKTKIESWEEFYKEQIGNNVESQLIELSEKIVHFIKTKIGLDDSAFCLVPKSFTAYTKANTKREVFANVIFNQQSIKLETLYGGIRSRSSNSRILEKKSHVLNEFTLFEVADFTEDVKSFLVNSYAAISDGKYDFLCR